MKIFVTCYAGYRADERPTSIQFGSRAVAVREIQDRWLARDHRYFKVIGDDDATYIIRQDAASGEWELTYFKQAVPGE